MRTSKQNGCNQYQTEAAPLHPELRCWPDVGIHAALLGHTTVLLKVDGFTILTDPVFSWRVGISLGPMTLGIKRLVGPANTTAELPPIDLIVLSHAHMDHFDLPSLRSLETDASGDGRADFHLLRTKRYQKVRELGWGQRVEMGAARVFAFEVAHWGARMRSDTYRSYDGYSIEMERHRIVFGGDTAYQIFQLSRKLTWSRSSEFLQQQVQGRSELWCNALAVSFV